MSIIGKLHEISLYGLITTIIFIFKEKVSFAQLLQVSTEINSYTTFFYSFLFWASVLYIPIAIIGAFATKYGDGGEGLTFDSDNIFVIIFAHIAEELLGLFLTPFWFLKDLFTQNFDGWRIFDYITYVLELLFFSIGFIVL